MVSPRLLVIALGAVLTMSAVPVLVKSTTANEITIGLSRLFIAVAAFTPAVIWRGQLARLTPKQWGSLLIIGVVFGCHWLTYFASIKYATPTIAALAIITYSMQYMVLARIVNKEHFGIAEGVAIAVCFAGCVIVTPELNWQNDVTQGIAIGLLSATFYAALPLLHQRAAAISTVDRTWGQFFFASLVFLPFWGYSEWDFGSADAYRLLVLGVVCTVVAHGLWVKSSTELPAIYTSLIYYLYLPLAMLGSIAFLGEELTSAKLLGCGLVVGSSVALSLYRYRRRTPQTGN